MAAWLVIGGIVFSVLYGYKTRRNIAPVAVMFSYLIGCGVLHLTPAKILSFIPVSILFNMFAITFFLGFSIENKTLHVLSETILYKVRCYPALTLPALFAIGFLLAMSGAGIASAAFVAPITFALAGRMNLHLAAAYVAAACGVIAGSNFMYSGGGVVLIGLLENSGYKEEAFSVAAISFLLSTLLCSVFFGLIYFFFRCWKCNTDDSREKIVWTSQQKRTLVLQITIAVLVFVPKIMAELCSIPWLTVLADHIEVSFIMLIGGCIASFMKLGNDKLVIQRQVPWTTIIMLGGMSMLIGVGKEAGMTELLVPIISKSLPRPYLAMFLGITAGVMSMFSSAIGVVLPTLFPLIPQLCKTTEIPASVLFIAVFIGATMTGISPLSTTGSMVLAGCQTESGRDKLFYQAMLLPFLLLFMVAALCFFLQMAMSTV